MVKLENIWYEKNIDIPSQELFLEAAHTLPINPIFSDVILSVKGIPSLDSYNSIMDGGEEYSKVCQEKGVMPFSILRFEYDLRNSVFHPESTFDSILNCSQIQNLNKGINGLIKGGKFHQIKFKHGFDKFIKGHLSSLLEQGYEFSTADLALTTYSLTGYSQGEYSDTQVMFGSSYPKGVKVKIGGRISEEAANKVRSWFDELYEKYQLKQEALPLN